MSRYATALFCDDIRNELNGKMSFMGVYGGQLYVASLPIALPKLCCALTVMSQIDDQIKSLSIRGQLDESQLFAVDLNEQQISEILAQMQPTKDAKGRMIQVIFAMAPFNIEKAGKLSIEIVADEKPIECPGLRIDLAPEGMVIV